MGIGLRALLAAAALLPLPALAAAQEGVKVAEIRFEGNRTFSEANLEYSMKVKEGALLDRDLLAQDEAMLHRFFESVSIREEVLPEGVRLIFRVTEHPLVSRVDFLGVESLPLEEVRSLADTRGGHPLAGYRLSHDRDVIARKYREAGYHWVEVQAEVLEDEGARRVVFRVVEGPYVEVDEILFRGNSAVPDGELRAVMALRPPWVFLASTPFVERRLEEDRVAILRVLRDRGFLEAQVWIEGVEFDEERDDATITVVVAEGEPWTVGEVTLVGAETVAERDRLLRALERIRTGQRWLRRDIDRVIRDLDDEANRQGHAEALVDAEPIPRAEGRVQDLRFVVREGPRFRIRSIDVAGNTITRDKVVLREFAVYPGDPLDSNAIAKAVRRVRDTGYFASVTPVTLPADEAGDKDVEIRVVEADRLRQARFGVGVSSDTGLFGMFSIIWRNFDAADWPGRTADLLEGRAFSGAGQTLALVLQPGSQVSSYRLSFTEPWVLDRRFLAGIDLYASQNRVFDYDENRAGVELRLQKSWLLPGEELDDLWSVGLRPRFEVIELTGVDEGAPPNAYAIRGRNEIHGVVLDAAWRRIDQEAATERGFVVEVQSELGGGPLGGDFDFWKSTLDARRVFTLWKDDDERAHTLTLRAGAGAAMTLEDGVKVPIVERLFAGGGIGTGAVRGFGFGRLGPHGRGDPTRFPWRVLRSIERSDGEPMGGDALASATVEYQAPLFADVLRGAVFVDAGNNAFNTGDLRRDWRAAAGFGLLIKVPFFGQVPLRFDFGWPLKKVDGDGERILWFAIEKYF